MTPVSNLTPSEFFQILFPDISLTRTHVFLLDSLSTAKNVEVQFDRVSIINKETFNFYMNLYKSFMGGKMVVLEIIRLESTAAGTLGVLRINKEYFCSTLELPDLDNASNISCIPAKQYICTWHKSPKFGRTLLINNVPNRDFILFHAGNSPNDTAGCILLGSEPTKLRDNRFIKNSGDTFKRFIKEIETEDGAILSIMEVY